MILISKGQITLELLLIVAISISLIVLFLPIFTKISNFTMFTIDLYSSGKLINNIEKNYNIIDSLANGSIIKANVNIIGKITIECNSSYLNIKLDTKGYKKEIRKDIDLICSSIMINGYKQLAISKQNDLLYLE